MQIFSDVTSIWSAVMAELLPFLFVLTIVVFFHELGHFLVARWCGVSVKAFSIGFGPELAGFNDRQGTRWKLSLVPLGGYVKFIDDENAASVPDREALERMSATERAKTLQGQPVAQRAAIVAAGPIANFILAFAIFTAMFATVGRLVTEPKVGSVIEGSAAAAAGVQVGDIVTAIDDDPIESFGDLQRIISDMADRPLRIGIRRGGDALEIVATPQWREITDRFGNVQRIGLLGIGSPEDPADSKLVKYGVLSAAALAVGEIRFIVTRTFSYIYDIIVGRQAADQLSGPLRIAQVSGQAATLGFLALINLAAVLSISIGLINLFPIPMLDGGHLFYYAIEAVRRRPLSEKAQEWGFRVGLALVLALMIFVTFSDLVHRGFL